MGGQNFPGKTRAPSCKGDFDLPSPTRSFEPLLNSTWAQEKGKALEAMKTGKPYPDGSVLIFELLEATTENNAIVEGSRKVVGVMEKDAKKFKATGGWGFEGFKNDSKERVVKDPKGACFDCHAAQEQTDYVFSRYRK